MVPYYSYGAIPKVTAVSDSLFDDGDSIIVRGAGFGTHTLDTQWLGNNIEQGTNNSEIKLPTNWSTETTSSSRQCPVYTTEDKHGGSKSIKAFFPISSVYTSGFTLNKPGGFNSAYATWWFKPVPLTWATGSTSSSVGQFKMFRVTPGLGGGIYADQPHNWYWSQQLMGTSNPPMFENGNNMLINFCRSSSIPTYDTSCYAGDSTPASIYRSYGIKTNVWQRIEVWTETSTPNTKDGTISILIHRSEDGVPVPPVTFANYIRNTSTRETTDYPWKNIVWENYFGNGVDKGNFYIDDVFVQFNSQARVEIGNSSIWSQCTHREIQIPTKWNPRVGDVDSVKITVNKGSFSSGQAFLFIVDDNGNPSNGLPVNFK
jgi:hypothetical protein